LAAGEPLDSYGNVQQPTEVGSGRLPAPLLDLRKQLFDPFHDDVLAEDRNLGVSPHHVTTLFFLFDSRLLVQVVVVVLAPFHPIPPG